MIGRWVASACALAAVLGMSSVGHDHPRSATILEKLERHEPYDLVLAGGRVLDPESQLDAVRNVAIRGGRIAAVATEALAARETLDVRSLVVAPGFIDLHVHGQDSESYRYYSHDGVTTALELEIGTYPVAPWYAAREGRALINHGLTVGHPGAARCSGATSRSPVPWPWATRAAAGRTPRFRRPTCPASIHWSSRGSPKERSASGSGSPIRRARVARRSCAYSGSPRAPVYPASCTCAREAGIRPRAGASRRCRR